MTEKTTNFRLVVQKGGIRGQEFYLKEGDNFVGRWDPESGSFPEIDLTKDDVDAKVSRKHAKVIVDGDHVIVEDLDSLNGTFVNRGNKLAPNVRCHMQVGDELIIGKVFLKLEKVTS